MQLQVNLRFTRLRNIDRKEYFMPFCLQRAEFLNNKMKITDCINSAEKTVFSIEVLPPVKGMGLTKLFESIDRISEFGPKYINITTHHSEYVYTDAGNGMFKRSAIRRRPGTVADRLPDQVNNQEKTRRSKQMIALCQEAAEDYARTYLGRTVPILLETAYPDGTVDGHTDTYLTVRVATHRSGGEIIPVRITGQNGETLLGEEA